MVRLPQATIDWLGVLFQGRASGTDRVLEQPI
jgi:hypothetical protein